MLKVIVELQAGDIYMEEFRHSNQHHQQAASRALMIAFSISLG